MKKLLTCIFVLGFFAIYLKPALAFDAPSCTGGYCDDVGRTCGPGYKSNIASATCGQEKMECCPDGSSGDDDTSGTGGTSGTGANSCPCMTGSSCSTGTSQRRSSNCTSGYQCCTSAAGTGSSGTGGKAGEEITEDVLNELNPLQKYSDKAEELSTPGGIVTRFLTIFAFPLGGLILFVMLVWGGFEMLMGAADKKSIDAGKQRITAALIGFLLLFASYWIAKIIGMIFGITIV